MNAILQALVRIAQRSGRFTVAEATALYNGLWVIVGVALALCGIAFVLNAGLDWKAPSLFLAIAFAIAAVYVWAKPLHIIIVAGVGGAWGLAKKIVGDAKLADEIENILVVYLGLLKWILLMGVTFLLFAGTISFKESPAAVLPLLVALGVIGLFTWMWPTIFVGTLGRRLVYGYAVVVVAISFGSLIPNAVWYKWTGWMPGNLQTNPADGAATSLEKTSERIRIENAARELRMIEERILREGRTMTPQEKARAMDLQDATKKPAAHTPATSAPASAMQKMPVTETVTVSPGIEFVLPTKDWEWVSFDPKGGCVHITRPDGIKYTDCEGMNTHMPPLRVRGEYVITAVDKEVRVVIVLW